MPSSTTSDPLAEPGDQRPETLVPVVPAALFGLTGVYDIAGRRFTLAAETVIGRARSPREI